MNKDLYESLQNVTAKLEKFTPSKYPIFTNSSALFWFGIYTYVFNLLFFVLEFFPHFIRMPIFALLLGKIGKKSYIDYKCYFRYPSRIKVGNHTTINRECSFFASHSHKNVSITIGNHVAVAPKCSFFSAGHDYSQIILPPIAESIVVKDYV